VRNRLTKAIVDSGGKVMAGSDTPEWFFAYGWTLHRELESLVAAGLTPYQALAAATTTPAEFLGGSREWGTVEVGKRADLVLLAASPLADIRHTTRIEGVSLGGRWLPPAELRAMVERATRRIGGPPPAVPPSPPPSPPASAPASPPSSAPAGPSAPAAAAAQPGEGATRSADWLALLPDGEEKRRFILDCTGCHQFDERIARPGGRARTEVEWDTTVARMLRYAGATTGFPVIAGDRDPKATARWLVRHLSREPRPRPLPADIVRGKVTEFAMPVPQDLPHDVAVDGAGRVVVTGMMTHAMYVLDPASGAFARVAIPVERANPRAVEIDSAGHWWVVLGAPNMLARYEPAAERWTTVPVGMYPHSLALGPGGVWFNGPFTRDPELIGRVAPGGTVETMPVPPHPTLATRPGGPIPYELRAGPDGRVWGSELLGNRVFAYDPAARTFAMFEMPVPDAGPRRLDADRQGMVWIPAYATNELVRLDPRTGTFTRYPLPVPDAVPYVARVDDATGTVWLGTAAGGVVLGFDRRTERFTVYELPTREALVRHLAIDPRTREVWIAYGASPSLTPARIARLRP
jgi:streptogramin lyase